MAVTRDHTGPILDAISSAYRLPNDYARCVTFMLSGLALVRDEMPEIAQTALTRASQYWGGHEPGVGLEDQKVILWNHLDRIARSSVDNEREEALLRGVLFVLDAKPATEDVSELLDWFVQFLCSAGASDSELAALLEAHFPVHGTV